MSSDRVSVHRRIAAPASTLFAIVVDPAMHVEIDGSGMLMAAPDAKPLTTAGDTFVMDMDREPLGDIPIGKYQVTNTVTRIVPGSLIEWTVAGLGRPSVGHVYGWELVPVSDDETEVTNYCDWSELTDEMRGKRTWPIVPVSMLEQSIENLDRIATAEPRAI